MTEPSMVYSKFKKELDVSAMSHADAYMLDYMKMFLYNLILTVPGVKERVAEETTWLTEFNERNKAGGS